MNTVTLDADLDTTLGDRLRLRLHGDIATSTPLDPEARGPRIPPGHEVVDRSDTHVTTRSWSLQGLTRSLRALEAVVRLADELSWLLGDELTWSDDDQKMVPNLEPHLRRRLETYPVVEDVRFGSIELILAFVGSAGVGVLVDRIVRTVRDWGADRDIRKEEARAMRLENDRRELLVEQLRANVSGLGMDGNAFERAARLSVNEEVVEAFETLKRGDLEVLKVDGFAQA